MKYSKAGQKTNDHNVFPANTEAKWSKVLPSSGTAYAMTEKVKYVDVSLFKRRAATPQ